MHYPDECGATAKVLVPSLSADVLGIPAGDCDCDGNQEDALGVCGGDCEADADNDGICDDIDECVGQWTPLACATARAL